MFVYITCHSCKTNLQIPESVVGSPNGVKCPCGTVMRVPDPAPPKAESVWHVAENKQKLGPFSSPQLHQLAQDGRLRPSDMVLQQGSPKWVIAGSVEGLFSTATRQQEHPFQNELLGEKGGARLQPVESDTKLVPCQACINLLPQMHPNALIADHQTIGFIPKSASF